MALMFLNAPEGKWSAPDLMAYCHRAFLEPGYLKLGARTSPSFIVSEGRDWVAVSTTGEGQEFLGRAPLPWIDAARLRVRRTLSSLRLPVPCDGFIHSAIYCKRVTRFHPGSRRPSHYRPRLVEGQRLSDWVLALFAADAIDHRDDYDAFAICSTCGMGAFGRPRGRSSRCAHHASDRNVTIERERVTSSPKVWVWRDQDLEVTEDADSERPTNQIDLGDLG